MSLTFSEWVLNVIEKLIDWTNILFHAFKRNRPNFTMNVFGWIFSNKRNIMYKGVV